MLDSACLDKIIDRFRVIGTRLNTGTERSDSLSQLARDYDKLAPLVEKILCMRRYESETLALTKMISDSTTEHEIRLLAEEELGDANRKLCELQHEISLMLLPKHTIDDSNAILEIRAGTGGNEASLFVGDLFRMYARYSQIQGWDVEVISSFTEELGGYKEIIAEISGLGAFHKLKFESGVHRVQRIPTTETNGRIHTSTATVAVLPEAEAANIVINNSDLKFDTYKASGAGGQHVNKTDSAVRVTHIPTGIFVAMQQHRSQHQNKEKAMKVLFSRLHQNELKKISSNRATSRKSQVGSGDRSERIRTYNFPQGRVTEHRLKLTLYKLSQILMGESLGEIVDALVADNQAKVLAS